MIADVCGVSIVSSHNNSSTRIDGIWHRVSDCVSKQMCLHRHGVLAFASFIRVSKNHHHQSAIASGYQVPPKIQAPAALTSSSQSHAKSPKASKVSLQ